MATYLTRHHGGGWKYQRYIPPKLRAALGGKSAFVRYIAQCPRPAAERQARAWAVQDDATLDALQVRSEKDLAAFAARGGLEAASRMFDSYDMSLSNILFGHLFHLSCHESLDPDAALAAKDFLRSVAINDAAKALQAKINAATTQGEVITKNLTWDGLYAEWVRIKRPGSSKRLVATTVRMLKNYFGAEVDCRTITPKQVADFRDSLSSKNVKAETIRKRIQHVSWMYVAASKEPKSAFAGVPNPAANIPILDRSPAPAEGRPFSAVQVRTILDTAARVRFGDTPNKNRHTEVMWMLRLMAFSGAAPNEIAMLQGGDVCEQDGITFFHIRNTDAITHQNHPKKSIKTTVRKRMVPLHSEVSAFYEYAAKFPKEAFIFGAFDHDQNNGRAQWLISHFGKFLRDKCRIKGDGKRLTLYSMRHRFHDAMDEANVPDKIQKRLVGHAAKDEHGKYGGKLEVLNEWLQRVKPSG